MQKILIVDDSEINREILAAMLETEYEIDMAKGGREAIDILEKKWETYQIVLLDLNMPVMNGYEVLKVMEEKQWLDSLPVICISSETSEASIGKVYELGATDYFTRPFDTAVVLRRVHNYDRTVCKSIQQPARCDGDVVRYFLLYHQDQSGYGHL